MERKAILGNGDGYKYILENKIPEKHWWYRARNNLIDAVFKRILKFRKEKSKKILDVGSGYGQTFSILQKFGNIYSVDSNKYFTDYQSSHYKNVTVWNAEFPDKISSNYTYDVICMFDFLEHTENPDRVLEYSYKILKKRGFLLITVQAYQWMWTDFDVRAGHFRRYSRGSLISEVENAGFKTIYSTYFISILFIFAVIVRKIINPHTGKDKKSLGLEFENTGSFLNETLYRISNLETFIIRKKLFMPFGLSILGIFQK
jgi:SAM-dependent methyltransferase